MTDREVLTQIEDICEQSINLQLKLKGLDQADSIMIRAEVEKLAQTFSVTDKNDIEQIALRLEERFDISMTLGNYFSADDYVPWLDENRGDINWFFWDRYKRHLTKTGFPPKVVTALDLITDKILDHIENPKKTGDWSRKGLVVGHVQSGKTANYSGVICKAADSGYKVIIVLAGMLSALRSQTQERIDEGFIGVDSSTQLDDIPLKERLVGVGEFSHKNVPLTFTTTVHDFKSSVAQQIRASLDNFNQPVVLVIKKNKAILQNLINWLKNNNLNLDQFPFLLIDDEADHASINTNKEDKAATAINSKIRELLKLFKQNMYLGYTATPFANIFIDPDSNDDMIGDELFPRDFIISLDAPSNYVGSKRVFSEQSDLDMVRTVTDHEDLLPVSHVKDDVPEALPNSLEQAIRVFILIRAMRILRGQEFKHNSMLINVSRFTDFQGHIKLLVHEYLGELRRNILNHYALPVDKAIRNASLLTLKQTFEQEFLGTEFDWQQIQSTLKLSISPIKTIEVNGSKNSEPLDYNKESYPKGRSIIAVGGLSLSRGLTLEGLTVSYFIRNTQMYDTLMQMGRWFGYRDGFSDLCRLYMPPESISWYQHVSDVTEELRDEFKRMELAKLTPTEFGLCVRSHPESLIVTARNKMRTGMKVPRQISLLGRQVETSVLASNHLSIDNNLTALSSLIKRLSYRSNPEPIGNNYLYSAVSQSHVINFIDSFSNHPASIMTEKGPILEYINQLECEWDIQLISSTSKKNTAITFSEGDIKLQAVMRTVHKKISNSVSNDKRRFGSPSWESAGIDKAVISDIKNKYAEYSTIPGKAYREVRTKPLLTIYILDCKLSEESNSIFDAGAVAWNISFQGQAGKGRPEKLVEYVVNTTWWNQEFGNIFDEEEELEND
jgi:hypothetical protein